MKKKATSKRVASIAAVNLSKSKNKDVKTTSGSALSQVDKKKVTSPKVGTKSSKLIKDVSKSPKQKAPAASALAQTPGKKKTKKHASKKTLKK